MLSDYNLCWLFSDGAKLPQIRKTVVIICNMVFLISNNNVKTLSLKGNKKFICIVFDDSWQMFLKSNK